MCVGGWVCVCVCVCVSYKGLMANSDSMSIVWTNDSKNWGHHFTYSAQKAKLSTRPWPGPIPAAPRASLHRCLAARMHVLWLCWHLGSSASILVLQELAPTVTQGSEDTSFQHRQTLAPIMILTSNLFSLKPCHHLGLEREIFFFFSYFLFSIFMWSPSAFWLVTALVRSNGLVGEMISLFLSWSCLKFLQNYLSQGLRPVFLNLLY